MWRLSRSWSLKCRRSSSSSPARSACRGSSRSSLLMSAEKWKVYETEENEGYQRSLNIQTNFVGLSATSRRCREFHRQKPQLRNTCCKTRSMICGNNCEMNTSELASELKLRAQKQMGHWKHFLHLAGSDISIQMIFSCTKLRHLKYAPPLGELLLKYLLANMDASALARFSRQFGQKYDSISSVTQY